MLNTNMPHTGFPFHLPLPIIISSLPSKVLGDS